VHVKQNATLGASRTSAVPHRSRELAEKAAVPSPGTQRAHLSDVRLMKGRDTGGPPMLWTMFLILMVLWLLGVVSSYTLGGFIHLLLVFALVALVIQVIQGRRVV
jgi:hypothetical protein